MDLLFQRAQHVSQAWGNTTFKLHAKAELTEEEAALVKKYGFEPAMLLFVDQPKLLRNALIVATISFIALVPIIAWNFYQEIGLGWTGVYVVSAVLAATVGFFYYHQKRETIYVRDLIHGRYFKCNSVIELAKKEAWLEGAVSVFRQVVETAKHWDGTQRFEIKPLPPEEAKRLVLKAF
ncbi:hypothetical protein [uncultured Litoreibacter sp.]|uniref:hypothetical protein n=1 Tax=uncultured Litoreibacter sp. TaxID=1392394 RepID=UPI0026168E65|nr:hypothetical protein [uncultured Litoreibacter sp.]